MTPRLTAWLGAGAALGIANVVACLTQPHAFSSVVLLWHGGTAALMLVLSVTAGRHVLGETAWLTGVRAAAATRPSRR
jgi:hypothetical protein